MAMLGIGRFDNVIINKVAVSKNDSGLTQSVDITFKKLGEAASDDLDFLNSGEISSSDGGKENNMRIYSVNSLTGYDGNAKTGDDLLNEVIARKDQLVHILSPFFTADKIKFDLIKGLGIKNKQELVQKITNLSTLEKMSDNMLSQFASMLEPVIGEDSKKLVVKFLRKSKDKNLPRFADKKLDWNPFIADMTDTALTTKIKFSKWEIENGFDSNAQSLEQSDEASVDELAAQNAAVNSVFG